MAIQSIRGFNDILPPETSRWYFIEHTARRLFEVYGFKEIRIPILEKTSLFARSIGESTDIVEKEMYTFVDKGEEQVTLRPEGTASVVRAFIQHKLYTTPGAVKLYYLGPMFRYERPQAGRYRQFYQIGVEAFGVETPTIDAEIITMLMELFSKLGIADLQLHLNSLGCPHCRPQYKDRLYLHLESKVDWLCPNCQARLQRNPLRVLDCKDEQCRRLFRDLPSLESILCNPCQTHFQRVQTLLESLKIPYQINRYLVRGLDYYTRTTFELISPRLGAQNAVAGGGRYDTLVEELGGPPTPALGFALGMERVAMLLERTSLPLQPSMPQLFLITLGPQADMLGVQYLYQLRQAGIFAEKAYDNSSLKSQLRKANRLGVPWVIILGEDELQRGEAIVKNMTSGKQEGIGLGEVVTWARATLGKGGTRADPSSD